MPRLADALRPSHRPEPQSEVVQPPSTLRTLQKRLRQALASYNEAPTPESQDFYWDEARTLDGLIRDVVAGKKVTL